MQLGNVKELLKGSQYENESDCISGSLEKAGIKTVSDLDNMSAMFGPALCRHSIWELIVFLREEAQKPRPKPQPKATVAKKKTVAKTAAPPKKEKAENEDEKTKVEGD